MNDPIAVFWLASWAIFRGLSYVLYWTVYGPMEETFRLTAWLGARYAQRRNTYR